MTEEFPSNANSKKVPDNDEEKKAQEPQKQVRRVVQGEIVRRKKPLGRRFAEAFGGGDGQSVMGYVMFDVLIPAAKDAVADAMSQGVERMLFGEVRSASRRTGYRPGSHPVNRGTNYNSRYAPSTRREDPRERERERRPGHQRRETLNLEEIIIPTRVEADEVIDNMFDLVNRYEVVSVKDLYNLLGETPSYTDNKWGWTDLTDVTLRRVRDGYLLILPRPEPLD